MRSLLVILLAVAYCEARPSRDMAAVGVTSLIPESYIIGGTPAGAAEFPWQLSQERLGAAWSHSCGASLLKANYALSAAHCVDGASTSVLRVWAGLTDRSDQSGGVVSNCQSYRMHESYGSGAGTYPNDIAIITLVTSIAANGGTIVYAGLPDNNDDQFVGRTFVLSGWGRTSSSNILPTALQKVSIPAISTADCNQRMAPVSGASVTDNMICFYDSTSGSCNGDSGGPANLNYPGAGDSRRVVAGVTSWGIQGGGACLPSYPSVYTRTSAYLAWIAGATP